MKWCQSHAEILREPIHWSITPWITVKRVMSQPTEYSDICVGLWCVLTTRLQRPSYKPLSTRCDCSPSGCNVLLYQCVYNPIWHHPFCTHSVPNYMTRRAGVRIINESHYFGKERLFVYVCVHSIRCEITCWTIDARQMHLYYFLKLVQCLYGCACEIVLCLGYVLS